LRSTITGFREGNRFLSSASCESQNIYLGVTEATYGCTYGSPNLTDESIVWVGHVTNLDNVISVALEAKYTNISSLIVNGTYINDDDILYDLKVDYDIALYACYKNSGCDPLNVESDDDALLQDDLGPIKHNFDYTPGADWKIVLELYGNRILLSDYYIINQKSATVQLLANTFQNQESLPTNGKIKSYLVIVTYTMKQPSFDLIANTDYRFATINRDTYLIARVLLPFCVFFTLITIGVYIKGLRSRYNSLWHALPEQRWILFYMIALLLFQNPVYCVVSWTRTPSYQVVYAAYIIDAAAQASFFTLWLIFSDGLRRQFDYYLFYVPKVLMGILIFGTSVVVTTMQFPSVTPWVDRSPVEAVVMWNQETKITFIIFSLSFLLFLWVW
jgi:hypothetical protein